MATVTDAVPLVRPHVVDVDDGVSDTGLDAPTVTLAIDAHPLASFTVTV